MVTRKTGRPVGRPPDPDKAAAIVEAGWTAFLAHGVEAVSVESIAAQAGVSKATFYKHFPDKMTLFAAGVEREVERIEAMQRGGPEPLPQNLRTMLRGFGLGLMGFLFSDPAIDFYGNLSGELRRHQALARTFYDTGPGRTRASLAALLAAAGERNEMRIDDPFEAAEHLFGLWQGFSNLQLSLGVESDHLRQTIERRIDRALDVFMCAYGPDRPLK